jgi:hypothetical protein
MAITYIILFPAGSGLTSANRVQGTVLEPSLMQPWREISKTGWQPGKLPVPETS